MAKEWQSGMSRDIFITGGTDATDADLVAFLQANAEELAYATFNITQLSGYSSLSSGTHTVGIKVSGTNYVTSDMSSTVTITKLVTPGNEAVSGSDYSFDSVSDATSYEIIAVDSGDNEIVLGSYTPSAS